MITKPFHFAFFLYILIGLGALDLYAQDNTSSFTYVSSAAQTFTVPTGTSYLVTIKTYGAGGSGSKLTSSGSAGAGGGGGAFASSTVLLSAGSYKVYVGKGGDGNLSPSVDGGDTYITNSAGTTTYVLAKGGKSAANNTTSGASGGLASASTGTIKFNGGNGGNGTYIVTTGTSGGGGSSAGTAANGNNAVGGIGGTAPAGGYAGANGVSGVATSIDGVAASNYGGGGSGALGNKKGGNGANGYVVITWNNQNITFEGNGTNIADNDTTTSTADDTDFGNVYVFSGSATNTFTITNTGGATLNLSGLVIGGTNASDFTVVSNPAATVLPGGTTTVSIKFDPAASGTRTATLSINTNVSGKNPFNFSISGTGTPYTDSDGDGVTDETDIDDDNDGIRDTEEQTACLSSPLAGTTQSVFLNETFGNGTSRTTISNNVPTASSGYNFSASGDVSDGSYAVSNSAQITSWAAAYWWNGTDHTGDTEGKMAIFNADAVAGKVFYTTSLSGLTPGIPVTYSFWVLNLDRTDYPNYQTVSRPKPNVTVEFKSGTTVLYTLSTGDIQRCVLGNSSSWKNFSASFTPTTSSITVSFKNNAPGGNGNDLALDDIKITQTYCDLDNDGDPDIFDLDDDNDGIPDIVEANFKAYSNNKSRMDMSNTTTWRDTNGNGMNDYIDTMVTNGTYTANLKDADGDGVKDFMDLDSDNDGIFDIDEANFDNGINAVTGDGDIDGDGKGDGADADNDGILDLNDDLNGYGSNFKPYPVDTDGDGIPDYLDLSSNGSTFDLQKTLYTSFDSNNDGRIDGSDNDKDGIPDTVDTYDTALPKRVVGAPRDLTTKKLYINFDGRNDYAEASNLLGGKQKATIMSWIKIDSGFTNNGVIIGQENFNIGINSSKKLFVEAQSSVNVYGTALTTTKWYHVAAVYDGSLSTNNVKLYLNGKVVGTYTVATGTITSGYKFTIAKSADESNNYFRGFVDEVRAFNTALTDDQIQKMVYQEIDQNGSLIKGNTIPKDITGTSWSSLIAYYRMDVYKNNVIDNYITSSYDDSASDLSFARIYNVKSLQYQTAPLPFVTNQEGSSWAAAITNSANFIDGTDINNYDYSIINVKHNITISADFTNAGLLVDSGKKITINNTGLTNTWYLKLDGTIDLQGKAQLIQGIDSDLAISSAGSLERDQTGTHNKYNYNYWSSPVSTINTTANNFGYTVAGVMKDGTTSTPQNINFVNAYDGNDTSPITIANYWIYTFSNLSNNYSNWTYKGSTGTIAAGLGYTMKGDGISNSGTQNYIFVGKPNNGTITNTVSGNNMVLAGNPYASALDAVQFIKDNISGTNANPGASGATNGILYFWEHKADNNSHVLAQYKGGYSQFSLTGGTPAVAGSGTNNTGFNVADYKTPKQYVPVGQGFFLQGSATGGQITFKNSQRIFKKEDDANSNTVLRSGPTVIVDPTGTDTQPENFKKIRLGFNSVDHYHRQILLGFMNEQATDSLDSGYDAPKNDTNPSDMFFALGTEKLVIQGVGAFNMNASYPLIVTTNISGAVKIELDSKENMDNQPIYIFDQQTGIYHDITTNPAELTLDEGTYNDRFYLRFTNGTLSTPGTDTPQDIAVSYTNSNSTLTINNHAVNTTIETAALFNILGQQVKMWDLKSASQDNINLPVQGISTGTYIARVTSDKGTFSKKIIVR